MDIASVGGILLAIIGILGGLMIEGGSIAQVTQPTAMMIVLGGTMGAVMLQFPLNIFVAALKQFMRVFLSSGRNNEDIVTQLVSLAGLVCRLHYSAVCVFCGAVCHRPVRQAKEGGTSRLHSICIQPDGHLRTASRVATVGPAYRNRWLRCSACAGDSFAFDARVDADCETAGRGGCAT